MRPGLVVQYILLLLPASQEEELSLRHYATLQGVASFPGEQAALERPAPDQCETCSRKPALLYIKAQTEVAEGPITVVFRRAFSVDNSSSRDRPGIVFMTLSMIIVMFLVQAVACSAPQDKLPWKYWTLDFK